MIFVSIIQHVKEFMQAFEDDYTGINNIHNAQTPPPFKKPPHWSDSYPKEFSRVLLGAIEGAGKVGCEDTKKLLTVIVKLVPKVGENWGPLQWVCILDIRQRCSWFQANKPVNILGELEAVELRPALFREEDELSEAEANILGIYREDS